MGEKCERTMAKQSVKLLDIWVLRVLAVPGQTAKIDTCQDLPFQGFPGGSLVKNPPAYAGDRGLSPGPGRPRVPWSN